MKNLLALAGTTIAKSLPLIGIGTEIKAVAEQEIKAATISIFGLGFASAVFLLAICVLVLFPAVPGYGIGLLMLSLLIATPCHLRLKKAKEKMETLRPVIESAQRVSQMAGGAINGVANTLDSGIMMIRGALAKLKQ